MCYDRWPSRLVDDGWLEWLMRAAFSFPQYVMKVCACSTFFSEWTQALVFLFYFLHSWAVDAEHWCRQMNWQSLQDNQLDKLFGLSRGPPPRTDWSRASMSFFEMIISSC